MKKAMSLFLLFAVSALLNACIPGPADEGIISVNPGQGTIILRAGESLTFRIGISSNISESDITWELNGNPVVLNSDSIASILRYTFYATNDNINDMEDGSNVTPYLMNVNESGGDSVTWEIIVRPSLYTSELSRSQAEDALYTYYAGIGHNNNGFLYGVMLDDLNDLTIFIAHELIYSYIENVLSDIDPTKPGEIINLLTAVQTHTMEIGGNKFTASINPNPSGILIIDIDYNISLYADFDETGMKPLYGSDRTYTGSPGVTDLSGQVNASVRITVATLQIDGPTLNSVTINARDTLSATYDLGSYDSTVEYDNWNISYALTYGSNSVNTKVIPSFFPVPDGTNLTIDSRDYRLRGDLYVDGDLLSLIGSGLRYQQVDNRDGTAKINISSGDLYLPGIERRVNLMQTSDIVCNSNVLGLWDSWISGGVNISGYLPSVDVELGPPGTASFELYSDGALTDTWNVSDWQE